VRELPTLAAELGLAAAGLKDESDRLGLPAFKILGASWAVERALREQPRIDTLVAASAGNHGRAVARVAARRGLRARIYLPARSLPARRQAIEREGAEVVIVDGSYEDAVAAAAKDGERPRTLEVADVGNSSSALAVIDGYATLFTETLGQGSFDLLLVPVGVGSLAAAAARFGAQHRMHVVGVEPERAACLTASIVAGEPVRIETPGSVMAGLDCAEISLGAWPDLRYGVHGTLTVSEQEAQTAAAELQALGCEIGYSGAAALAGLRILMGPDGDGLRALLEPKRVLLIGTEGRTDLAKTPKTSGKPSPPHQSVTAGSSGVAAQPASRSSACADFEPGSAV
jgi:diaminopropionate ammonia-lyase